MPPEITEQLTEQIADIATQVETFQNGFNKRIDQRLNRQIENLHAPVLGGDGDDSTDTGEFDNFGELIETIRFNPTDTRARALEQRALEAGTGASGGYLVPDQFLNTLLRLPADKQIFRPLAQVIPAGSPPDAPLSVPALDQSGSKGLQGGVSVSWIGEGDSKPETDATLNLVTLKPNEVAAHIIVTDKLLRNSTLAAGIISQLLAEAINSTEEDAFFDGGGGGRPLGILGCDAELTVSRATSSEVNYIDLANMLGKAAWATGPFVWIISQTVLPQLLTLTDGSGALIWSNAGGNAIEGTPLTLLGMKLFVNSGAPILGTKGDVALIAPKAYLIKDGSPMRIEASQHVKFLENKTVIRASWNVDGKPWLREPLTLKDGATEVSPFVVLE